MNYCKLIEKQKKLKNRDCLGLDWTKIGIIFGIPTVIFIISFITGNYLYDICDVKYNEYLLHQSEINESIRMEESIKESIQESQYLKESSIIQESIDKENNLKEEKRQQIIRQEYEDRVIKKKVPYGTMVRNENLNNQVGKIISYQGNRIFTDTDYWFDLNEDLSYPDYIKEIGRMDYLDGLNKLQKSRDKEIRNLAEKLNVEEKKLDTEYTRSLFKIVNGYDRYYFKCKDKYYRVKKIDGLSIYTKEGPVFNSKLDNIVEVPWMEYDRSLVGKDKK